MIASVTAFLHINQVIFLIFNLHIRTFLDNGYHCVNILLKLTDNADSGYVLHFRLQTVEGNAFSLHFLQNAGNAFYTADYLFHGRIQVFFLVFSNNMVKLYNQFPDCQFIGTQEIPPQLYFHSSSP